jgi:Serine kinase of the HPr protein, regulates carbohydrate metabolism
VTRTSAGTRVNSGANANASASADNRHRYRAFGLRIDSDIPLPELGDAMPPDGDPDLCVIRAGAGTKPGWPEGEGAGRLYAAEGIVAFRVPQTAAFRITDGCRIEVYPDSGADEDRIRLYILGTCMGALLLQRRILPLHGSVVARDGRAYAIVGESGAGKSTLSAALLERGFRLVTDDVAAIVFDERGTPLVMPAYPQQKLWQDSLDRLQIAGGGLRPLFDRETKFAVPADGAFCPEPVPLVHIYELVHADGQTPELQPIARLERCYTLYRHTFRRSLIVPSGLAAWHFETSARLAEKAGMHRLLRPAKVFAARESARLIEAHAKGG